MTFRKYAKKGGTLDKKIVELIHLLPSISVENVMLYFSVSQAKANELLNAFIHYIEQGDITHIKGNMYLVDTPITSLGNLQTVGGSLDLYYSTIASLGPLKSVGKNLELFGVKIKSLDHLQSVGGDLNLMYTRIKSLGDLQSVGGDLYIPKNQIPQSKLVKVQVGGRVFYDN